MENTEKGNPVQSFNAPRVLTPRERQIFFWWAGGIEKKVICQTLKISPNTYKTHIANINKKLS